MEVTTPLASLPYKEQVKKKPREVVIRIRALNQCGSETLVFMYRTVLWFLGWWAGDGSNDTPGSGSGSVSQRYGSSFGSGSSFCCFLILYFDPLPGSRWWKWLRPWPACPTRSRSRKLREVFIRIRALNQCGSETLFFIYCYFILIPCRWAGDGSDYAPGQPALQGADQEEAAGGHYPDPDPQHCFF